MSPRDGPVDRTGDAGAVDVSRTRGVDDKPSHGPQDEIGCLLVGIDRRPASQAALSTAAALATRLHARLEVVHVVDLADFPIDPDSPDWETSAEATVEDQRRQVTATLASFTGTWALHVRRGTPATVLAATADDSNALMIVLGAGQRGAAAALARMVDGSTVRDLVGPRQRRPVLLVPAGTPQDTR